MECDVSRADVQWSLRSRDRLPKQSATNNVPETHMPGGLLRHGPCCPARFRECVRDACVALRAFVSVCGMLVLPCALS